MGYDEAGKQFSATERVKRHLKGKRRKRRPS